MARGWINKSSRSGRVFSEEPTAVKGASAVIRPGVYSNGLPQMGVPAGRESTRASSSRYEDKESHKYRADYRGDEARGLTGALEGRGTDPTVHSKNTRRYGHDGSRLEGATFKSTGTQPAPQQRDQLPPSWSPKTYTDRVPPGGISRRVGWLGNGQPFVPPVHTTTRRHGSDGAHDLHSSTDAAQGQGWHASGGQHGQPSPHRPQRQGPAPGAARADVNKLNRESYISPQPGRGPKTR